MTKGTGNPTANKRGAKLMSYNPKKYSELLKVITAIGSHCRELRIVDAFSGLRLRVVAVN